MSLYVIEVKGRVYRYATLAAAKAAADAIHKRTGVIVGITAQPTGN